MDWSYDATTPGNVVQTGRVTVNGLQNHQQLHGRDRLRPHRATARCRPRRRRWPAASRRPGRRTTPAGTATSASLKPVPAQRPAWSHRVERLGDGAGRQRGQDGPRRLRRRARPAVGLVELPAGPRGLPRGVVARPLPDRHRAARRRRQRGRRTARWTSCGSVQQRPDGSFPQNSRLDGTPVFGDLQMDEVAFPIVLAHQLGRTGAADWAHVKRSADYIVANGPRTPQERWENATGYSPATIAAEIAGLVCAADIATQERRRRVARRRYLRQGRRVAAAASSRWTATTTGAVLSRRRTTCGSPRTATRTSGDADAGLRRRPADRRAKVVDPSFLDLVRLGVKRADDPVDRATRSRSSTTSSATRRPTVSSGTGPASTGTASRPTAASGSRPTRARA